MIADDDGGVPSLLDVETHVSDDKKSVLLSFRSPDGEILKIATDTESVDNLLQKLGQARLILLAPVPNELIVNGSRPLDSYDPRWHILPDNNNELAVLALRHPGFGWSIYGLPRHEAASMSLWLRKIAVSLVVYNPQATFIGTDQFRVGTDGLGFYYYGKDERRIGLNPFQQVEFDSDRAAGIVASSIAERRLEESLRSRMRSDAPTVCSNLFRPSGALGTFSAKIELAYVLGLLSDHAYKDFIILKAVRNAFAHELELNTFDTDSIRDRCKNFLLVDRHIGPVPEVNCYDSTRDINSPMPYLGLPNFSQRLADPRFRFIMTAQIMSFKLGIGSDSPGASLPLV